MFIPISDDNSRRGGFPWVNTLLIVITCGVWFLQLHEGSAFTYRYALVPYELTRVTDLTGEETFQRDGESFTIHHEPAGVPLWVTLITSAFLHGGWLHLGGNMLYLWIFGDQIEDILGAFRYLVFYISCGIFAGLAHVFSDPSSIIPLVGASGSISGVLGAYLMSNPGNPVTIWFFIFTFRVPAFFVISFWFLSQLSGYMSPEESGVAYMAHIGGFVAGLFLVHWLKPVKRVIYY
jgi:membrane associated rhomboid family serine protease